MGRAERYDILAVNQNNKSLKISVKSSYLISGTGFPLSDKDEINGCNDFYYAFILLNEFKSEPDFWIIPSKRVNEILYNSHHTWLGQISKKGNNHKDSTLRKLPIKITEGLKSLYPQEWEIELRQYYKNIEQLEKI